jgi:hypothetical protein
MVIYYCDICNFSSKLKPNYNRHRKTKKHLFNIKDCEEDNNEINTTDTQKIHTDTQKIHKDTQKIHKIKNLENLEKSEICIFCTNTFNTRKSMLRHIRLYCKEKKDLEKMEKE